MDRVIILVLTTAAIASASTNGTVEILRSPSKVRLFRPEPRDSPTVVSSTLTPPEPPSTLQPSTQPPSTQDVTQPAETTPQPASEPPLANLTENCERLDYEDGVAAVFRRPQDPALLVFNSTFETPFAQRLGQEQLAGLTPLNSTSVNCTDYIDLLEDKISPGAMASLGKK